MHNDKYEKHMFTHSRAYISIYLSHQAEFEEKHFQERQQVRKTSKVLKENRSEKKYVKTF